MLNPRIIPCLLLQNKGLVKTTRFADPKYVGDPINAVKIFNEKEVDELIVLDIDATSLEKEPDFNLIEKLAYECQMPLCYGGGIKNVAHAERIFALGVEKVSLSSIAIQEPKIIKEISDRVGSQSVVVVIDVKRKLLGGYDIYTHNGKRKSNIEFLNYLDIVQDFGAGEIVINSIDNDGMMKGYDHILIDVVRDKIKVPLTVMGGAASLDDFGMAIEKHGVLGLAAGSLFVFKGKYKAVLINYPSSQQKNDLIETNFSPHWVK